MRMRNAMITPEELDRVQQLHDLIRDNGLMVMRTEELEEWTELFAKSLSGKGDQSMD